MSTLSPKTLTLVNPPAYPAASPLLSRQTQRQILRLVLLIGDGLMLVLAFSGAYWLRFDLQLTLSPEIVPSPYFYPALVALLVPLWLGLFALSGLYDIRYLLGGTTEYARALNACTVGFMLVVAVTFLEPRLIIARGWLITSWLLSVFLMCCARFWLRRMVYALRDRGYFLAPAAVVGTNGEASALAEQLLHWKASGLQVLGFVNGLGPDPGVSKSGLPVLGCLTDIEEIVKRHQIEDLLVATTALGREELLELYEQVIFLPNVELHLSSGLFEVLTTGLQIRTLGTVPLVTLNKLRLDRVEMAMKTVMEYLLTLAGLVLLFPIFCIIALLIKFDSPGSIFYRRRVYGMGGKVFDAFKFRTMFVNGDEILARRPDLSFQLRTDKKLKDDPRVTRVGHWLRSNSLDELPQLFNVLLGQMSLVGPRMISPEEGEKYGRLKMNLLTVKPGITGLWQVSGRSDVSYQERVRLDMHYICNYSIWQDLQILFIQTPPAVLKRRGAY